MFKLVFADLALFSVMSSCGSRTDIEEASGLSEYKMNESSIAEWKGFFGGVFSISVGYDFACTISHFSSAPANYVRHTTDCFGGNPEGLNYPSHLDDPIMIDLGSSHVCVFGNDEWYVNDKVKCSGSNKYGQRDVPSLNKPRFMSTGQSHSCAIDDDGVKCWGDNEEGQINVPLLKNPSTLAAGSAHTCAIDDEGVKCWGSNKYGQINVPPLNNPTVVAAGLAHTCTIDDDRVECWGSNDGFMLSVPSFIRPQETLPWALNLQKYSYQHRKLYFEKIVSLQEKLPIQAKSSQQQLLFLLQEGFVKASGSILFERYIKNSFLESKSALAKDFFVFSSLDIPLTPEHLTLALQVLEAALSASRSRTTSDTQAAVAEAIADVNSEIASGPTQSGAMKILDHIFANKDLITEYQSDDSLLPYLGVFNDVRTWVQH